MAVFGRDFYGLVKYGADTYVDFKIDPFTALPDGYNTIRLKWTSPSGDWSRIRLLKNRSGYAANETDGIILLDEEGAASEYVDTRLPDATWYYYTLFLLSDGAWVRVGTAGAMSVGATGMYDLVKSMVPRYFHYQYVNPDAPTRVWEPTSEIVDPTALWEINRTLHQFLSVLAWGLDYLKTYAETTPDALDPEKVNLANLSNLAATLGSEFEHGVPASLMRKKVANAANLAKSRGSLAGLRDAVYLNTGYDVEVAVGNNLFLSEDQASFTNPQYPEWSPAVMYAVDDRVKYQGYIWKCTNLAGDSPVAGAGAYGNAQKPPTPPLTSNDWWTQITAQAITDTVSLTTGAYSTWKPWQNSAALVPSLAIGVSSPVDNIETTSNALRVPSTVAAAIDLWGAANPIVGDQAVPLPTTAIRQGIPVPRVLEWSPTEEYEIGEYVVFEEASFRSLQVNTNKPPVEYPDHWEPIGYDDRLPIMLGFYGHAGYTGTSDDSALATVTPGLAFFDGRGNLISTLDTNPASTPTPLIDTFSNLEKLTWDNRDGDFNNIDWTTNSGVWVAAEGKAVFLSGTTGRTTVTPASPPADYKVTVKFMNDSLASGTTQALVARYTDDNNCVFAARTKVVVRASGSVAASHTFTTALKDGDRVTLQITAANVKIFVNDETVERASLAHSLTGQSHGLAVISESLLA